MTAARDRVLALTGATGFVGRHLVRLLEARAAEIRVLSRRPDDSGLLPASVRVFRGDLCDPEFDPRPLLDRADILFHCAGEVRSASTMKALHIGATRRLLDAAAGRIRRWVQLGSVGAYGPRREGVIDESTPLAPRGEYEVTKAEADRMVLRAGSEGAFETVILRPSIVFGIDMPNDSLRRLVRVIDRGLFFFIGPRGAIAPYVAVEEVARALWLCGSEPGARGVYNLSENLAMEEFVGAIAAALERPAPRYRVPVWLARAAAAIGGAVPRFPLTQSRIDALTSLAAYDSSRIRDELGFAPEMPIGQRLAAFVKRVGANAR